MSDLNPHDLIAEIIGFHAGRTRSFAPWALDAACLAGEQAVRGLRKKVGPWRLPMSDAARARWTDAVVKSLEDNSQILPEPRSALAS